MRSSFIGFLLNRFCLFLFAFAWTFLLIILLRALKLHSDGHSVYLTIVHKSLCLFSIFLDLEINHCVMFYFGILPDSD